MLVFKNVVIIKKIDNNSKEVLKAPITRYFIPASIAIGLVFFFQAISAYDVSATSSIPKNNKNQSLVEIIKHKPSQL
jgi:hypothetical protein